MRFDTHCHLNDEQFQDDLDEVVRRAREDGIRFIVVPGIDVESSRRAIAIAQQYDGVYAAVGIHPESAKDVPEEDFETIRELARHEKVVAIGEIGLDYYWDTAPREQQHDVLRRQIAIAGECSLPIIIHNRESTADVVRILKEECPKRGVIGVMHCFTGSVETAKECMKIGFYISFGGPVTFKNAVGVREVAEQIPTERLLIETDSPYLSPHPFRGKRNEPMRVNQVLEVLSQVRAVDTEELALATTTNAFKLFSRIKTQ